MRQVLPAVLVTAALGAAFVASKQGPSRESVIPLSRAVADHEKALDRTSASVFPLSADEEREIGARMDAGMNRNPPAPGTPQASRAALWREMGQTAAASPLAARFRGRWEFRTTPEGGLNAFALPGGFLYATDALVARLSRDPDALLFVVGHELGHVQLGHTADGYRLGKDAKDPVTAVLGGVLSVGRIFAQLHFSETQELEADAFAAKLLKSLKKDPRAGLRAMDALGLRADSDTKRGAASVVVEGAADYFKTHPGSWERRAAIEREADR